jgi:hypothetical protein
MRNSVVFPVPLVPRSATNLLGGDEADDADREADTQRHEQVGQRPRQDDRDQEPPAPEAEAARGLDQLTIDALHAEIGVRVHREGRGSGDEDDLEGLVDAEPRDDERNQGQERDGAQHLHRRIDQLLAQGRDARADPEDEPRPHAERDAQARAAERREQERPQLSALLELDQRPKDVGGRGEHRARDPGNRHEQPG